MIATPSTPTLFPYTTLFRSAPPVGPDRIGPRPLALEPRKPGAPRAREAKRGVRGSRARDRKSTRLNSSHLVISYAVFCLKKKKKQNHIFNNMLNQHQRHYLY